MLAPNQSQRNEWMNEWMFIHNRDSLNKPQAIQSNPNIYNSVSDSDGIFINLIKLDIIFRNGNTEIDDILS